jgi:Tannase and feruloyl esterase
MALSQVSTHANCSSQALPFPTLPGAQIRSLLATSSHQNLYYVPAGLYSNNGAVYGSDLSFCNVTVTYTPNDSNRTTTVQVLLPTNKWNGRMQAVGGSGWSAGLSDMGDAGMLAAVAQGYTAIGTDGGIGAGYPQDWALKSNGEVDMNALGHYASTCLNDLSIVGKAVARSFYGSGPQYSYWNGCSQGGRQGMMIAQKYPQAFDGIVASAPPVNWGYLMPAGFWSQMIMHELGVYINPCELSALTAAAIKACDGNDGVIDGLISDPDSCKFDPYTLVNSTADCLGAGRVTISKPAADLAYTGWNGVQKSNQTYMHRPATHEASLVSSGVPILNTLLTYANVSLGLADRTCRSDGTCVGKPFKMVNDWLKYFIKRDANYDSSKIDLKTFDGLFQQSVDQYTEIIGTGATDLSGIREAGVKVMSYHGLVSLHATSTCH